MNPHRQNTFAGEIKTPACDAEFREQVALARLEVSARRRRIAASVLVLSFAAFGVAAEVSTGCNPAVQRQVVNAIPAATACVIDVIQDVSGQIDIGKTAATCGATVEDIIAIVQSLMSNQPDAGAAVGVSPDAWRAHLQAWLDAAEKAKASK